MAAIFDNKEQHDEMCATFATLILQDAGLEISAENITKLVAASGNEIEPYWAPLFAGLAARRTLRRCSSLAAEAEAAAAAEGRRRCRGRGRGGRRGGRGGGSRAR